MSPHPSSFSSRPAPGAVLDLTESRPERCELAREGGFPGLPAADPAPAARAREARDAREAVARYLADRGAGISPGVVVLTPSMRRSHDLLLELLCRPGDAVLVPSPCRPVLDPLAARRSVETPRYPLRYRGEWRIDRRALARAVTPRTRAVVVASPANPTGALPSPGDLEFVEELCAAKGLALVGDEAHADTALEPPPGVAAARRCLAFHLAGLSTVCGAPRLASWIAVSGPAPLVAAALPRLERLAAAEAPVAPGAARAVAELLPRREAFLAPLRDRLATSRAMLAAAALREAPWTLLRSGGGWSGVLEVGGAWEEGALCQGLLEDGVVVRPGFLDGFDRDGYLVVSLLARPAALAEALERLERRLRAPVRA